MRRWTPAERPVDEYHLRRRRVLDHLNRPKDDDAVVVGVEQHGVFDVVVKDDLSWCFWRVSVLAHASHKTGIRADSPRRRRLEPSVQDDLLRWNGLALLRSRCDTKFLPVLHRTDNFVVCGVVVNGDACAIWTNFIHMNRDRRVARFGSAAEPLSRLVLGHKDVSANHRGLRSALGRQELDSSVPCFVLCSRVGHHNE